MTEKVKLALIGCGWISGAHIKGYQEIYEKGCREYEYTACCDIVEENARQRAAEIGAIQGKTPEVFTDVEDLIKADIAEAGELCLPHYNQHSIAINLLKAGLHVLVEKPLGITINASKKMIDAAEKQDLVLATAENVRRKLPSRAFRWAINSEKLIGDIKAVDIYSVNYAPFDANDPKFKWRLVKLLSGGGMIMDSGSHLTDMMLHMFGEVDEVFCTMNTYDERMVKDVPDLGEVKVDVEDSWHVIFKFKEGPEVTWTYSRELPGPGLQYGRYYGTEGVIEDDGFVFHCFQDGGTVKFANGDTLTSDEVIEQYRNTLTPEEEERFFPYGCVNDFGIQTWDFCNAISTGRQPELDGKAGLRAKALCESCFESATLGQPVKYQDVLSGKISNYQTPIDEYWGLDE